MAQFGSEIPLNESGGAIEWAVSFRFPVSWDSLSIFNDKSTQPVAANPIAPAAFARSSAPVADAPPLGATRIAGKAPDPPPVAKTEWGIVVPKMERSARRPMQTLFSNAAQEPALEANGAGSAPFQPPPFQSPSSQTSSQIAAESSGVGVLRTATFGGKAPLVAVTVAGVALLASVMWLRTKAPAPAVKVSTAQPGQSAQQNPATEIRVATTPSSTPAVTTAIATPAVTTATATPAVAQTPKFEKAPITSLPIKALTPSAAQPVAIPVTPRRPAGTTDASNSAPPAIQAAQARAAIVADPGEPARTQVPIATPTVAPREVAVAPPVQRPLAPPVAPTLPSVSTAVTPASPVSASATVEPQAPLQTVAPAPARVVTPAAPASTVAIRTGGQLQQAQLISRKSPVYPVLAQRARVEGSVILDATVGTDGRLKNIKVLDGHPLLQSAALDAVKQWVYKPATLNGIIMESDTHLVVTFGHGK